MEQTTSAGTAAARAVQRRLLGGSSRGENAAAVPLHGRARAPSLLCSAPLQHVLCFASASGTACCRSVVGLLAVGAAEPCEGVGDM